MSDREKMIELIEQGTTKAGEHIREVTKKALAEKGSFSSKTDYDRRNIYEIIADTILADNWVRLPCKVGDTLYDITEFLDGTSHPEIYELQDVEMMIEKNIYGEYIFTYDDCYICSDKIGISLFPTKEEAVQALKGGVDNA